ncbi:MAG: DUF262 domain-containing protein [Nitrospirota bacterium]|nr:DUF262 domain-containing protein [Nitrospirota bacterium]
MNGTYDKAITIKETVNAIDNRQYLLPAIQRKFTWSSAKICALFDSIMQGYPINTFMFWEVTAQNVKNDYKFYEFLSHYCEYFEEKNPEFNVAGRGDFNAVIDGQQRLTSFYIGLKGTYAQKLPRKHWPKSKDDAIFPPKKLYLNLQEDTEDTFEDEMMKFGFKFLTEKDIKSDLDTSQKRWFLVGEVLSFEYNGSDEAIRDYVKEQLASMGYMNADYSVAIVMTLYKKVCLAPLIYYYKEISQEMDRVLNVFLRTNHGGVPLSFSDLLFSVAVSSWKKDARKKIDDLVDWVRHEGFSIDRDFVLKASLMLTDGEIKFRVQNFSGDQVQKIESEWEKIEACLRNAFTLVSSFGLNDYSLRSKNAVIPIAYYLYLGEKYTRINAKDGHDPLRKPIQKWLNMVLLKGTFGSQGDYLLSNLRKVLKDSSEKSFPLQRILKLSQEEWHKDMHFDRPFIEDLLKTQKDDPACRPILFLLYPDLDFTRAFDIDHLHPADHFKEKKLQEFFSKNQINNPLDKRFYRNKENWNGIANLQLLPESSNRSKNDTDLESWFSSRKDFTRKEVLIPEEISLSFPYFKEFVTARRELLAQKLESLVEDAQP